jgi:GR25 family glycosyltransferase involved in LPS biosynthesis
VLVINLASRPERLSAFEAEMRRLAVDDFVRFDAIFNESGIQGCTLSHAAVLREMGESGWDTAMICEDDARFSVDREELDVLIDAFLDDDQAEVACLAYWHREVYPHSLLYLRTTRSFTTACYLIKASIAIDLAAVWEEAARMLAEGGDREVYGLDHVWNGLQRTRVFLIPIVRAARQEPGYSDIWQEYVQPAF